MPYYGDNNISTVVTTCPDMVIKPSWTECRRGSALNLTFQVRTVVSNAIEHTSNNNYCHKTIVNKGGDKGASSILSTTFDIDGLAQVRYKFVQVPLKPNDSFYEDDPIAIKISSRLNESVLPENRGEIVYLNVHCKELEFSKKWVYSEEWTEWIDIGKIEVSEDHRENGKYEYYQMETFELTLTVSKKKIVSFAKLYDDRVLTDFRFGAAGCEETVEVHKVLLSAHSEVFKTMFCNEWKETTNAIIEMKEVTLQTLKDLKKYIYLNILPDDMNQLCSLLVLANYYMMDILVPECITKIIENVTAKNLQSILAYASDNKILKLTFAIIEQVPSHVVDSAQLNRLKKEDNEENVQQASEGLEEC